MHNTMDDVADRHMQAKEAMTELQKADRHMHNTSRNFLPKENIAQNTMKIKWIVQAKGAAERSRLYFLVKQNVL